MSGTIIPLFSKRSLDFTALSASGSCQYIVAKGIAAGQYTEGTLLVRVHSGTSIGGSGSVAVQVATWAPTPEDPENNNDFVAAPIATATVSASHSGPDLIKANLSANFGDYLIVAIAGSQDVSTAQTVTAVLSAELVLKA